MDELPLPGLDDAGQPEPIPEWLRSRVDYCSTCHAPMIKARHEITRRASVIDAAPNVKGNLILAIEETDVPRIVYRVANPTERQQAAGHLHLSHFVTCPDANKHRTPRSSPK